MEKWVSTKPFVTLNSNFEGNMECPADINQSVLRMYCQHWKNCKSTVWHGKVFYINDLVEFNCMDFARIHEFAWHFLQYENPFKIHSTFNKGPYNLPCCMDFRFFLPCQPTSYSEDVSYNQFHLRCSCVISIPSSNL